MQPYTYDLEQQMQRYYQSLSEKDRRRYAAIAGSIGNCALTSAKPEKY